MLVITFFAIAFIFAACKNEEINIPQTIMKTSTITPISTSTRTPTHEPTITKIITPLPSATATQTPKEPELTDEILNEAIKPYADSLSLDIEQIEYIFEKKLIADNKEAIFVVVIPEVVPNKKIQAYSPTPLLMTVKREDQWSDWEIITWKNLANIAGVNIGNSKPIAYTMNWNKESRIMKPILAEHGNTYGIYYDANWYNPAASENSLRPDERNFNYKFFDAAVNFGESNDQVLTSQFLLHSIPKFLPPWLLEINKNEQDYQDHIMGIIEEHIRTLVSQYPQIDYWGVLNEINHPRRTVFWKSVFGLDDLYWIQQAFSWAHEANPNAKLYYNDFKIEFGGQKSDQVYELVKNLKDKGTPIHAIGFQMHLRGKDFLDPVNREEKLNELGIQIQRYNQIGIEVLVTEFDLAMMGVSDDEYERYFLQAEIQEEIIKKLLESGVKTIIHFGGIDRLSWKEKPENGGGPDADATAFGDQGELKPNYYAEIRAIYSLLSQ